MINYIGCEIFSEIIFLWFLHIHIDKHPIIFYFSSFHNLNIIFLLFAFCYISSVYFAILIFTFFFLYHQTKPFEAEKFFTEILTVFPFAWWQPRNGAVIFEIAEVFRTLIKAEIYFWWIEVKHTWFFSCCQKALNLVNICLLWECKINITTITRAPKPCNLIAF